MNNENETQNTKDSGASEPSEEVNNEVVEAAQGHRIGPVAILTIAVLALLFVLWFIIAIWSVPKESVVETPVTPPAEVEVEETVDLTVVPDRDPTVLGLRIDANLGRFFTLPGTGHTLYYNKAGDCVSECLENFTPYLATSEIATGTDLTTVVRNDNGELQYTWKGNTLYTYNDDTERSVLGGGYAGTWRIARP